MAFPHGTLNGGRVVGGMGIRPSEMRYFDSPMRWSFARAGRDHQTDTNVKYGIQLETQHEALLSKSE